MTDLGMWISILIWPAGVAMLVLAVHLTHRRERARWLGGSAADGAHKKPAE